MAPLLAMSSKQTFRATLGDMTSVAPQRRANSFIQNALKLSETPVPLRLSDIILPSRWNNFCFVSPFNIIDLPVRGNYSDSFSI